MSHTDHCLSAHDDGHPDLAAVLDVVGSWAVTTYGVEHLYFPEFRIPTQTLMQDWERILDARSWADGTWYAGALRAGRLLHGLIQEEAEDSLPEDADQMIADLRRLFGASQ